MAALPLNREGGGNGHKTKKDRAPPGLYLSLIAAIVALGLYVVQRQWNLPLQIALGVIVIGLALAIFS
jgi:hypothetical protein